MPIQLDELSAALEVRLEPGQRCSCDAELGLQPLKQYAMVDCVERRGQVQADLDCDLLD